MAPWRQVGALVAVALLMSSCGSDAVDVSPSASAPSASSAAPDSPSPSPSTSPSPSVVSPTGDPLAAYYGQELDWVDCGDAECASLLVPLDYSDPDGAVVDLAVARVPARGERYGSLFVNPGGPGGSAVDYAKGADYIVTSAVREHYDIVGVDPRGVASSDPVECLTGEEIDELIAVDGTPDDAVEEQEAIDVSASIGDRCASDGGPLIGRMGTIDAARDLDVARSVLGDETLAYLGKSYGSSLGQVYALLFPDRVGRLVLDGALPVSLDNVAITEGQANEFEVALRDFVRFCQVEMGECALSGTVDDGAGQLRGWLQDLDADPIPFGDRVLNEPVAAYAILSYLYFPPHDYRELTYALNDAILRRDPEQLFDLLDARLSRDADGRYLDNSTSAFYAVTCLDNPFEGTVDDVRRYAEEWSATAPTFGPALAWGLLSCKDWPAVAEPLPRPSADPASPILVVSTTHDPATPYPWGVLMAEELPGSVLLTLDGFQHTAYTQGSACVDAAVDAYLLEGALPEPGTVCQ